MIPWPGVRPAGLVGVATMALLGGCRAPDEDGFRRAPRDWHLDATLVGEASRGFGLAVGMAPEGTPRIGAPLRGARLHAGESVRLEGDGFLGAAVAGDLVGAPGQGSGGRILDGSGATVAEGAAGRRLGTALIQGPGGWTALDGRGVVGAGAFEAGERLWSLAWVDLDGRGGQAIAGRAVGGLAHAGGRLEGPATLGRGLTGCDLDADGDDELVVGEPGTGRVFLYRVDDLDGIDLGVPDATLDLGAGAGFAVACVRGGLLVGAPDRPGGGAVAWVRRPLEDPDGVRWLAGRPGGRLGHALAVGGGRILAGDPGSGEVRVYRP